MKAENPRRRRRTERRHTVGRDNDAVPGVVRSVWFARGRGRQGCAGPAGWGAGLPGGDDWPACNAVEMRAVVRVPSRGRRCRYRVRHTAPVANRPVERCRQEEGRRYRRSDGPARACGGSHSRKQVTMSKSGILDTLRNEERSLRNQLVAIQRAIEAIEGTAPPVGRRGRKKAAQPVAEVAPIPWTG